MAKDKIREALEELGFLGSYDIEHILRVIMPVIHENYTPKKYNKGTAG